MEKARVPGDGVKNSLEVEPDDSQCLECSKLHMNLLAMLALKFMFGERVTDLTLRAVKTHRGAKQSPIDNVIFTCKRRKGGENSEQWSCLIIPSQSHEVSLESTSIVPNQSLCNDFMEYYKIYRSLKEDPDQDINPEDIKEVIIYFGHSSSINPSQNMLEELEVRDLIFGSKLLKWKNDFGVRKELVARVLVEFYPHVLGNPLEKSKGLKESNILEFCDKVAFVRECPGWEELETSAKMVVKKNAIGVDPDRAPGRLMSVIKDLWRNKKEHWIIRASEFKKLFAEVLTDQNNSNKCVFRFNVSGPVSDFVGRESQLRQMWQTLKVGTSGFGVRSCTKLVLSGLGGMGKSELAREYCRRHYISLYDSLLWINAENAEAIGNCFKTIAFQELGIKTKTSFGKLKDILTVIKETIDKLKDQRTLFIYDNAESLQKIKKYLPCDAMDSDHILHVIITSQYQDWEGFPVILLDSFEPKEALSVVKRSLGHLPSWKEDDGLALCEELGYYPLALKQAVSYIHEQILHKDPKERKKKDKSLLIPEYLQLLKGSAEFVLDHSFKGCEGGDAETTFKTLMSTIDHLRKSLTGQVAITFLNIATYLFPENIDVDSMSSADPKYSREVVERSFMLLSKLSVMSVDGRKARVHRLVQSVNRIRLRKLGSELDVLRNAMNFACAMGSQHVINVWESLKEYPDLVREFSTTPGDLCEKLVCEGNCETVLSFSELAVPVLLTHLGKHSEEVMRVEIHMAQSYLYLGKYDETERFLKIYLFKWRNTSRYNEPYCIGMFLYGCLLEILGRVDEALDVYKEICSKKKVSRLCHSMCKLKIISLMLREGVQDEEEWDNLEQSSRLAYKTIRTQVEIVGFQPDMNVPLSVRVNNRISRAKFGYYIGVTCDDIVMVFLCFQQLPFKTGKWEEAYRVCKWCIDILSKEGKNCQVLVDRGRLQLAMMLVKLENLHFVNQELMELTSKLNVEDDEEAYTIANMMLGRVLCLLNRFDEGIPKILDSCFNRSHDAIIEAGLGGFLLTVCDMSASGSSKEVPCIVDKLLSEMLENVGEKGIPLYFLDKCISGCHKLFVEGSSKLEAMNLMKHIYQILKIKVGEGHPLTLHAKIMFARFCIWFGKKNTFMLGISYLQEVRNLLVLMIHVGDHTRLSLLKDVERDLSFGMNAWLKKMKNEKFSVLPSGN